MATKEIDYEAAYKDLSNRINEVSEECSAVCKRDPKARQLARVFDELYGMGDIVLVKHIK